MNNLFRTRTCCFLKWICSNLAENNLTISKTTIGDTGLSFITQNPRFYRTKSYNQSKLGNKSNDLMKESKILMDAQDALIEYLHSTRNLQYSDAENISKNAPKFVENLLRRVENEEDAKQSLRKLFCYHPINEFEPFFESMGMRPSEYSSLLPRGMIYLTDDQRLLLNYHVLCEYGISPNKIGKIYVEASEVFTYGDGVLLSKLDSLQAKGFTKPGVAKLVIASPNVLVNEDFLKAREGLSNVGIANSWFEENVLEGSCYNWIKILETLCLFEGFGFSKEDLKELLYKNPAVLIEDSGGTTISLLVFLIKFRAPGIDLLSIFKQFPVTGIRSFQSNLRNCYHFLLGIEMDSDDIADIMRAHWHVLGSCTLKTVNSLSNELKTGKKRLCEAVKENPRVLKNWVHGKKVSALPNPKKDLSKKKIQFLLNLGFIENSSEMSKALKLFRGNGGELQERFDCLVNAGLTHDTVAEMVKVAPQVMNQTRQLMEMKIDLLVNGLGYNVSSLVKFPAFLAFSIPKIKLRFAMYNWLTERGKVNGNLALSTVLASSDRMFVRVYVGRDPEGLIVCGKFKEQFLPNENGV